MQVTDSEVSVVINSWVIVSYALNVKRDKRVSSEHLRWRSAGKFTLALVSSPRTIRSRWTRGCTLPNLSFAARSSRYSAPHRRPSTSPDVGAALEWHRDSCHLAHLKKSISSR